MKEVYAHAKRVTDNVHQTLIGWVGNLLKDAGMESVDVWGRFPPEGTVRSHLVLFPYRVGPEPKNLENARGGSIMRHEDYPSDRVGKIPRPWRELGRNLLSAVQILFPEAGQIDTPRRQNTPPFPPVSELPPALRAWYEAQHEREKDKNANETFVVDYDGVLYARPPSLMWRPGVSVWAHYIAVAGDAGRGVSDRTSDAPPLSLAALSTLTLGIQMNRVLHVELPPAPFPPELNDYLVAIKDSLEEVDHEDAEELFEKFEDTMAALTRTTTYPFGVVPVHDLTMHEFALLTQALQRPLQAVLNFKMHYSFGDIPEFQPSSMVSMRDARRKPR